MLLIVDLLLLFYFSFFFFSFSSFFSMEECGDQRGTRAKHFAGQKGQTHLHAVPFRRPRLLVVASYKPPKGKGARREGCVRAQGTVRRALGSGLCRVSFAKEGPASLLPSPRREGHEAAYTYDHGKDDPRGCGSRAQVELWISSYPPPLPSLSLSLPPPPRARREFGLVLLDTGASR